MDNGRCLKPTQSCNNYTDCDDGSDEAISYCRKQPTHETNNNPNTNVYIKIPKPSVGDFETLPTLIEIMTGGGKGVEGLNITDKPEICEYITRYDLPRGIKCHGRRMNETWDTIPWNEFDLQAKVMYGSFFIVCIMLPLMAVKALIIFLFLSSVDNGAINTSKLKETPDVHLNFSNLLRV